MDHTAPAIDHSDMALGKLPAVFDKRTLRLEAYLDIPKLPPLPPSCDWFHKVSQFPMDGNDKIGDCVVAGAAHMIQAWTANAGRREDIIPQNTVVNTYWMLTGGQDTGLNLLSFLKFWRKTGLDGHKIGAFASINPANHTAMRYANYLFGGIYLGLELPLSCQNQKVWDVPPGGAVGKGRPGSWGGHCVNGGIYNPNVYTVATWGTTQEATVRFMDTYADEAYAIITLEWFNANHKTPTGLAWKDLVSDLAAITKGT